jgi:hypothetical protein
MKLAKCGLFSALAGVAFLALASSASAAGMLVNDTWQDGNRNQPDAPANLVTYAENNGVFGVDADGDGDRESRWFRGGAGTLDPVGAGGPLRGTGFPTSSASWTTYFTDAEGNEVNLTNLGDALCVTWDFTIDGVNATNTSQNFRIAVVDSPSRLALDGSPASAVYAGYAMFGNMGATLGHARPLDLMSWAVPGGANNLLSTSAAWASSAFDGTNGNPGYANGVAYTYKFMAQRVAGGLSVSMSITGAGLDGAANNGMSASILDASPDSYKFDTFSLRPSSGNGTAQTFDTSRLLVELKTPFVPEPGSLALFGLGALAIVTRRRGL